MYEPYVKQLLETMKRRQAEASKYPDVNFLFDDFKSCIETAEKAMAEAPLKRQSIIDFMQNFRLADHLQGQLMGLARKHLIESEAQTFGMDLQSETDSLLSRVADLIDRIDSRKKKQGEGNQ